MSIIRVYFPVSQALFFVEKVIVLKIDIDGHHVHRLALLDFVLLVYGLVTSEVRGLVHIQPDS